MVLRLPLPLALTLALGAGGCAHGAGGKALAPTSAATASAKTPPAKKAPTSATARAAAALGGEASKLAPVAPKAGEGVVHVACTPSDARVEVDGVTYGLVSDFDKPPYLRLSPGEHRIVLRKKGYEPYRTEVYLSGSVIETLTVSLTRRAEPAPGAARETPP